MTSDGSPYTRFKRALQTRNIQIVLAAARELPQIGLRDALEICLLLRDSDNPILYERATVRWIGRFALEARNVSLEAIDTALDALATLTHSPEIAMEQLAALCQLHDIR